MWWNSSLVANQMTLYFLASMDEDWKSITPICPLYPIGKSVPPASTLYIHNYNLCLFLDIGLLVANPLPEHISVWYSWIKHGSVRSWELLVQLRWHQSKFILWNCILSNFVKLSVSWPQVYMLHTLSRMQRIDRSFKTMHGFSTKRQSFARQLSIMLLSDMFVKNVCSSSGKMW